MHTLRKERGREGGRHAWYAEKVRMASTTLNSKTLEKKETHGRSNKREQQQHRNTYGPTSQASVGAA